LRFSKCDNVLFIVVLSFLTLVMIMIEPSCDKRFFYIQCKIQKRPLLVLNPVYTELSTPRHVINKHSQSQYFVFVFRKSVCSNLIEEKERDVASLSVSRSRDKITRRNKKLCFCFSSYELFSHKRLLFSSDWTA
jgi:hypothetical protein